MDIEMQTNMLQDQVYINDIQTQDSLNEKENTINKSSDVNLGTSDILFPTQNATKTYIDTLVSSIPAGATGATGAQGVAGSDGATGPMGPEGMPGMNGIDGTQGPQGEMGPQGEPGMMGAPGMDGSNASVTIGAISSSSSANGATINAGELNLAPADEYNGGIVTISNQIFAGDKSFNNNLNVNGSSSFHNATFNGFQFEVTMPFGGPWGTSFRIDPMMGIDASAERFHFNGMYADFNSDLFVTGLANMQQDLIVYGNTTSNTFVKQGGTATEYLMANGTVSNGPVIFNEAADEFTSFSSQNNFTLSQVPATTSKVKMYINGIRISNAAYSVSGSTLTYNPAFNGNYSVTDSDRIQFDYSY
jgi:hypothetical protein